MPLALGLATVPNKAWVGITGFLLLLAATPGCAAATASAGYSLYVVPQFQAAELQRSWGPILERVQQATGLKFTLRISRDIPSFEADLNAGKADFAYMNPYHQVQAHASQGYVPLLRDNKPLVGLLLVRQDSPIKSVQELQGKSLAFPAPNALGASLLIRAELSEHHRVGFQAFYAKTHANTYRQVLLGKALAGGGVRGTLDAESDEVRAALRVLMETPPAAAHPLSAHPRVPPATQHVLAATLIQLAKDKTLKRNFEDIPMPNPVQAEYGRDYAPLEKLHLERYVE